MAFHISNKNPRDTTRHKKYIYTRRSKKIKKFLLSCTDTLIFPQGGEKTIDANFNCATNQFSRFSILRNKGSGGRGGNNSFLYDRCTKNCNATIRVTSSRYFLQANHFHRLTRRIIFLRMRDRKRLFLHRDVNEKKRKRKGKENTTKR